MSVQLHYIFTTTISQYVCIKLQYIFTTTISQYVCITTTLYIHNHHFSVCLYYNYIIYSQPPYLSISVLQLHCIFTTTISQYVCITTTLYIHNHHFSVCQLYSIHSQSPPPATSVNITPATLYIHPLHNYGNSETRYQLRRLSAINIKQTCS
jgi:hypothetical protein